MAVNQDLIAQWKKDETAPFEGWDFSYLKNRMVEEEPPWDYTSKAKELIKESKLILDIATGGGEKLASLGPFEGKQIVAMEGYKPNVVAAEKNLAPLGIKVIYAGETDDFPFKDESFDLVLNRHGGLNISEIVRVLKQKGIFLTEQMSGESHIDLMDFFEEKPKWPENVLHEVKKKLTNTGMSVKQEKAWEGKTTFKDVGALVYYLKAIPWIVEGFSVENNLQHLEQLQKKLDHGGKLIFTQMRFLVSAQKT